MAENMPLGGIRVLDLSMYLPGPLCSQMMADFGAEVIKVEPLTGDWIRAFNPKIAEDSALFYSVNRNKKSIGLDLKRREGQEIYRRLVGISDIVLEQFRPGVMDKLGLGYETLKEINQRLIYCSITGYGYSGPLKNTAGHDVNYLSLAGITGMTGTGDYAPCLSGTQIADIGGGSHSALIAILLALVSRANTGKGQFCDVAMFDGAVNMTALSLGELSGWGKSPERGQETLLGGYACYNIYETKDGKYVSLGGLETKFWEGFCLALGMPEFVELQWLKNKQKEMITRINSTMRQKTRQEWVDFFADSDICFTPVLTVKEMVEHPQVVERETVTKIDNYEGLGKDLYIPGIPFKLSETPGKVKGIFPRVGEHTNEILKEAGYSEAEINKLSSDGVLKL